MERHSQDDQEDDRAGTESVKSVPPRQPEEAGQYEHGARQTRNNGSKDPDEHEEEGECDEQCRHRTLRAYPSFLVSWGQEPRLPGTPTGACSVNRRIGLRSCTLRPGT